MIRTEAGVHPTHHLSPVVDVVGRTGVATQGIRAGEKVGDPSTVTPAECPAAAEEIPTGSYYLPLRVHRLGLGDRAAEGAEIADGDVDGRLSSQPGGPAPSWPTNRPPPMPRQSAPRNA